MSRHLDRALEAIDGGLQRSEEPSYGYDRLDRCWRCQKNPSEEGSESELCAPCRAHLLGDEADPLVPTRVEVYIDARLRAELERRLFEGDVIERELEGIRAVSMISTADVEALADAARSIVNALAVAFEEAARRIVDLFRSIDWTPILEEVERWAAAARQHSRSSTPNRPTLSRGASRPPRDLRATEAPRRPPTIFRRKTP